MTALCIIVELCSRKRREEVKLGDRVNYVGNECRVGLELAMVFPSKKEAAVRRFNSNHRGFILIF